MICTQWFLESVRATSDGLRIFPDFRRSETRLGTLGFLPPKTLTLGSARRSCRRMPDWRRRSPAKVPVPRRWYSLDNLSKY